MTIRQYEVEAPDNKTDEVKDLSKWTFREHGADFKHNPSTVMMWEAVQVSEFELQECGWSDVALPLFSRVGLELVFH